MKIPYSAGGMAVLVLVGSASRASGGDGASYTFREAPVHSRGVRSLSDLRGKPVLIDFWGTR
jgi:hypothetical protein